MNKTEIHKVICDQLHAQYAAKNADYGNSFAKTRSKYENAILIRLHDKFSRLEELLGSGRIPCVDESVDDTLADLANYCIMELVERRSDEQAAAAIAELHGKVPADMADLTSIVPDNCIHVQVPRNV